MSGWNWHARWLYVTAATPAQVVEWGVNMMTSGGHKLREAERAAKQARKGIWTNWTPPATGSAKLSDNFSGTAREVVSGDCVVVADSASGERALHALSGSSVHVMRLHLTRCWQHHACHDTILHS